jgi:hypothetical protein
MKEKRENPYQMLMNEIISFCEKVKYRHTVTMFSIQKEKLGEVWSLKEISDRVQAAEQLGYDVVLKMYQGYLNINYVKKIPDTPIQWQR